MSHISGYDSEETEPDTLEAFVQFMNPIDFVTSRLIQFVDYLIQMQLTDLHCIKEAADATLVGSPLVAHMGNSRFTALNSLLQLPAIMNDYSRFQHAEKTFDVYIEWAILLQERPYLNVWCYGCITEQGNQMAHTCVEEDLLEDSPEFAWGN